MLLFCTIESNKEDYKWMMFAALYEYLIHIGMRLERNITFQPLMRQSQQ